MLKRRPSCQAKRAALFAENLEYEILAPTVPHRHLIFTIPRALRGLFERDRKLLSPPAVGPANVAALRCGMGAPA